MQHVGRCGAYVHMPPNTACTIGRIHGVPAGKRLKRAIPGLATHMRRVYPPARLDAHDVAARTHTGMACRGFKVVALGWHWSSMEQHNPAWATEHSIR